MGGPCGRGCWPAAAPTRVQDQVKRSLLRGRGGAGFPVAVKWSTALESAGDCPCYVIANGDEGDPGSYVDRLLMESDPDGVLEGMALAALAVGATQGYGVDPRRIELARYADVHLQGHPGSNVAVFNGLAHVLLAEGLVDEEFLAARADGLDELRRVVADHSPERVQELSGVDPDDLRRAARVYGAAGSAAIVYGLGITEHAHGTDGVRTLANLAVLTGNVGSEHGGGVNPLRGQNNVQGASDMGRSRTSCPATSGSPTRRRLRASRSTGACRSTAGPGCAFRGCSTPPSPATSRCSG
jgi:hypothetical protein